MNINVPLLALLLLVALTFVARISVPRADARSGATGPRHTSFFGLR